MSYTELIQPTDWCIKFSQYQPICCLTWDLFSSSVFKRVHMRLRLDAVSSPKTSCIRYEGSDVIVAFEQASVLVTICRYCRGGKRILWFGNAKCSRFIEMICKYVVLIGADRLGRWSLSEILLYIQRNNRDQINKYGLSSYSTDLNIYR